MPELRKIRISQNVVLTASVLLTACGSHQPNLPPSEGSTYGEHVSRISRLLLSYQHDRALAEAESLRSQDPTAPFADFLIACSHLDRGRFSEARVAAQRAWEVAPHLPELTVLKRLVDRREAHPTEGWAEAMGIAWRASGEPDLRGGFLKYVPELEFDSISDGSQFPDPDQRLAHVLTQSKISDPDREWLHEQLRDIESADLLWLALARLGAIEEPSKVQADLMETLRTRFPAFVELSLLASSLTRGKGEFTTAEISHLQRLAAITPFALQHMEAVRWLYDHVPGVEGAAPVDMRIYSAAVEMALPVNFVRIRERLDASTGLPLDQRRIVSTSLHSIAARWLRYPTALEKMIAASMIETTAKFVGEQPPAEVEETRAVFRSGSDAGRKLAAWPLPSLLREHVLRTFTDEMELLGALSGRPAEQ